jgi:hypothetical protein
MVLGALLGFVAAATVAVAGWLFWVIQLILPQRDPARIPFWTAVAFGFLGYGVVTWIYLLTKWSLPFRIALAVLSLVGIAFGAYAISIQFIRAGESEDFEGYLVLMGAVLSLHGAMLLVHTLRREYHEPRGAGHRRSRASEARSREARSTSAQ